MLNHNLRGRGTWHRAWHLGRELGRRGHEVSLWTAAPHHYYRPISERREGVTVVETPSWAPLTGPDEGWGPLDAAYRCCKVMGRPYDLCYAFAHPPNVWAPAWLARCVRHRPLLWDWCDWYEGGVFPKRRRMREAGLSGQDDKPIQSWLECREVGLERRMLRMADRVTVISERLREVSIDAGRRPEEVLLIPNGADLDGIRPLDAAACRAELGLAADGLYVGYVANYHPDQEMLLRALARAREEIAGLQLVLAGPPFAEPLVRELELGEAIVELGVLPSERMATVLGAADALVLPLEDNEHNRARVPYKFTDYLAAGRPVVTCPVGDLQSVFAGLPPDQLIGVASDPNHEAFARGIIQVMAPGVDRAAMGAAARRLAERRFSWAVLTDRLEAFINEWLGESEDG